MACVGVLYVGCRKTPKYSEVPNIQYKNISLLHILDQDASDLGNPDPMNNDSVFADSITIGIHFQDGNGDLGFPEDQRDSLGTNRDYFIDVYSKTNGIYNLFVFPDSTFTYDAYMPLLSPINTSGPIEGDLFRSIVFTIGSTTPHDDTIKFVVKIKDRAGNFSNSIETDPVILNQTITP